MADTNGHNSPDRLDRIEGIIEALANRQNLIEDEFARLLRAQIVMGDHLTKLTEATAEAHARTAAAQARTEENLKQIEESMHALILTVDEIIRGRKKE